MILWCKGRIFVLVLFISLCEHVDQVFSIKCRQCEKRFGSCDVGECSGQACVLVEVSNSQKSRVIKKTCSGEPRYKSECIVTYPDGIESILCYCVYDFCNSDAELDKIGFTHSKHAGGSDTGPISSSASASGAGAPILVNHHNNDRNKRTNLSSSQTFGVSTNYLVMLIFMCLFITGSFSLLIFNTVCVHLC